MGILFIISKRMGWSKFRRRPEPSNVPPGVSLEELTEEIQRVTTKPVSVSAPKLNKRKIVNGPPFRHAELSRLRTIMRSGRKTYQSAIYLGFRENRL